MEKTIELATCHPGGPVFGGSYQLGGNINIVPWEPEVGNIISLQKLGVPSVSILVRITEARQRKYKGEVIGFEGCDKPDFQGLKPEDSIPFAYAHIFTYMR